MKILIAVPTYENILPETFKSIYDLDKGGHECVFEFVRGYGVAQARNRIVDRAKDIKADYIFMVDNDVTFPRDTLITLLDDPRDVCLGAYPHRPKTGKYTEQTNLCKLHDLMGNKYFNFPKESQYTWKELQSEAFHKIEIHGGGLGCALIKTSVFDRLKYPWFNWVSYADRHGTLSEDLFFSVSCKKAGIPIYADTRVKCGHVFRSLQEANV